MATITSPRVAPNQPPSPTSSVRSSLSIDRSSVTNQGGAGARRNRSALRDFYNLQVPTARSSAPSSQAQSVASNATSGTSTPVPEAADAAEDAELDRPEFEPQAHVDELLKSSSLGDALRTESRLLSEIRGLDGEKKALVYDNYSKLIRATDTIGRMRGEMEKEGVGLEGVGGKLEALVGDIVQRAESIASTDKSSASQSTRKPAADAPPDPDQLSQRQTVEWILQTPERLKQHIVAEDKDTAEQDWSEVRKILDRWKDVEGVDELRVRCASIMDAENDSHEEASM